MATFPISYFYKLFITDTNKLVTVITYITKKTLTIGFIFHLRTFILSVVYQNFYFQYKILNIINKYQTFLFSKKYNVMRITSLQKTKLYFNL
jgi:hypothetical protein